jgi:hypothetical protein
MHKSIERKLDELMVLAPGLLTHAVRYKYSNAGALVTIELPIVKGHEQHVECGEIGVASTLHHDPKKRRTVLFDETFIEWQPNMIAILSTHFSTVLTVMQKASAYAKIEAMKDRLDMLDNKLMHIMAYHVPA